MDASVLSFIRVSYISNAEKLPPQNIYSSFAMFWGRLCFPLSWGVEGTLAGAWTSDQIKCVMERITPRLVACFSACVCSAGNPWGRNCLALCDCMMHIGGLALGQGCWKMLGRGKISIYFL